MPVNYIKYIDAIPGVYLQFELGSVAPENFKVFVKSSLLDGLEIDQVAEDDVGNQADKKDENHQAAVVLRRVEQSKMLPLDVLHQLLVNDLHLAVFDRAVDEAEFAQRQMFEPFHPTNFLVTAIVFVVALDRLERADPGLLVLLHEVADELDGAAEIGELALDGNTFFEKSLGKVESGLILRRDGDPADRAGRQLWPARLAHHMALGTGEDPTRRPRDLVANGTLEILPQLLGGDAVLSRGRNGVLERWLRRRWSQNGAGLGHGGCPSQPRLSHVEESLGILSCDFQVSVANPVFQFFDSSILFVLIFAN